MTFDFTFDVLTVYLCCECCEPENNKLFIYETRKLVEKEKETYVSRSLIHFIIQEVIFVQSEVMIFLTQRHVIHFIDEAFKPRVVFTSKFFYLLPNFLTFCTLLTSTTKGNLNVTKIIETVITSQTHSCLSFLNLLLHSSNSLWFISMNNLIALYISPWMVLFQCVFELLYKAGNIKGRITLEFSVINDIM